jgi:SAM-dependent methyltransferase
MSESLAEYFYPEHRFGGFTDVDGTIRFYARVNALIQPSHTVLDIGCGRGGYGDDLCAYRRSLRILKGKCRRVIGIDVDEAARDNPFVDEFCLTDGRRWSLPDSQVDLCLCDHVLEHLLDPSTFFREVSRVTLPGGFLCIRTPNAWSYEGVASRLIPNKQHAVVLGKLKGKGWKADVYPTMHRCNTRGKILRMLSQHGFDGYAWTMSAEPSYLVFSKIVYGLGVILHRYAPRAFQSNIVAFGRKRGDK